MTGMRSALMDTKKGMPRLSWASLGGRYRRRGTKLKGVFGAGALLPQFLAELTDTLNSQICNQYPMSASSWQA